MSHRPKRRKTQVETVSDFTAWLQDELQQKIQTPVEFTAEKIDEETGLPLADCSGTPAATC